MSAVPPPPSASPTMRESEGRTPPPSRRLPVPAVPVRLTYVFIGINVLVFIAQYMSQTVLGGDIVTALGAKVNQHIIAGEYWRLVTPIFIHVNLIHLFVNCYSLYVIGPQVEIPFGYARHLLIYLLSGIAGVILSFALSPNASVGASGAIFGLVGALALYLYRNRTGFGEFGRQRLMSLLFIIGLNLFFGVVATRIDNWGHVGGLTGGAILGWLIAPEFGVEKDFVAEPRVVDRNPLAARWLAVAAFALALGALTSVAIFLQR
ncbi:MAG: rhomboid family intramembrane serine protease [Chloroflexi bacterium]|nr:rhomboid family intramembrane serine protease [Chloroflexota bacterium]